MHVTEVAEDIYELSINVENILFESLWEIPNGVSLNSYIIKGDKTAIVDGVCGWDGVPDHLFALLGELEIPPESIEYLIINHMEPDHSGWIEDFKKINNNFKIICNIRAKDLLESFFQHTGDIICVGDGDTLDLGKGHILSFTQIPNVHWPDTMVTLDSLSGTLFTCDAFGSFGTLNISNFDDLLNEEQLAFYENEAVRYYSNILASLSVQVKQALDKCSRLPFKIIAPGHGLVWRKNPNRIIDDYYRYTTYQKNVDREEITVLWGSMYGMTERAVNYAVETLEKLKIKYHMHKVPETSWGTILASVWTSSGIILAMPTYEVKMFPPVAAVLEELGRKKAYNRKVLHFGSYGWSGGAKKELDEIIKRYNMNWSLIDSIEFKGDPRDVDFLKIKEGVKALVNEIRL